MAERMKTIFVIGQNSYIGGNFVAGLLKSLSEVDKVYLLTDRGEEHTDSRLVNLVGTLANIEKFSAELGGSNFVYYLDDNTVGEDKDLEAEVIIPFKKIIDLLKGSAELQSFIHVTSAGEVGSAVSANQEAFDIKSYLLNSGIPYTIFKTGLVYGRFLPAGSPLSALTSMALQNSLRFHGKYKKKVSLIHVEDLVCALLACLQNKQLVNQTYTAEVEVLSIGEVLAILVEHIKGEKPAQLPFPSVLLGNIFDQVPAANHDNHFKNEVLGRGYVRYFQDCAIDCITTHINNVGYWIITGANSGIGYEMACRLHAGGKKLILVDKDTKNLVGFGGQVVLVGDLTDKQQIYELINKIRQYTVFGLINNAGIGYRGNFDENSMDQIERMIAVNVEAPLTLAKNLLPSIIKNRGTVINIASSAAYNPLPGMSVYAASKSFILNWSISLWHELRGKCLVVTCSPSGTNTRFQEQAGVKNTTSLLNPRYVANKILASAVKRRPFLFLGRRNQIFIFFSRFLPAKLNVILWGYLFKKLR